MCYLKSVWNWGFKKKKKKSWAWWRTPLIPALGRQRQADFWVRGQPGLQSKLQDSQGYTEKPCLKKKKKNILITHHWFLPLKNIQFIQSRQTHSFMGNWIFLSRLKGKFSGYRTLGFVFLRILRIIHSCFYGFWREFFHFLDYFIIFCSLGMIDKILGCFEKNNRFLFCVRVYVRGAFLL
jgi:hypothetical protein